MFIDFFQLLRRCGVPISFQYIIDFFAAWEKGLVTNLDRLFIVMRLIFVKRVEHFDAFERAFAAYFLGQIERLQIPEVDTFLASKPFQEWLNKQIEEGNLSPQAIHDMPLEELLQKFWETLLKQQEEHHGGSRWIGTGGTSPWGHSGYAQGGIRVHGAGGNKSAIKVLGQNRYTNYKQDAKLGAENIRQALATLKHMIPVGPQNELDVDETIYRTCKNGGEIDFVFKRELRDRLKVVLFMDNGGYSMMPYVRLVRLLFSKMRSQFKDLDFYYFHNCIYEGVYSDVQHRNFVPLSSLFQKDKDIRLFIVGDANMAPSELFSPYGAINYYVENAIPGIDWLRLVADTFPYAVWLNPIEKKYWHYQSSTLEAISEIFHMQDLTLNGLKNAVTYLEDKKET